MTARRKRRTDGRYTVTLRYEDPLTGTRKRAYFYGQTQAEANAKAKDARTRLAAGAPVRDASRSVAEWLEEWRGTFLQGSDRADATKTLYEGLTRRHVEPHIGQIRLDRIKPSDVSRLLISMESAGKSSSTRRNTYAALRGALDDAVSNGLLAANPVAKVKRPRSSQTEARFLTLQEVSAFLTGAVGLRYATVLKVILGTGLRRGEVLALRWADVDLEPGRSPREGFSGASGWRSDGLRHEDGGKSSGRVAQPRRGGPGQGSSLYAGGGAAACWEPLGCDGIRLHNRVRPTRRPQEPATCGDDC